MCQVLAKVGFQMTDSKAEIQQGFFIALFKGDHELVNVYWGGYFILGGLTKALIGHLEGETSIMTLDCLRALYLLLLSVVIWKSANNYKGKKLWRVLAKISVVLIVLESLVGLTGWGMYLTNNLPS